MLKFENILKGWKTTLIGILILITNIYYWVMIENVQKEIFAFALVVALALLLSPDTLVNGLKGLIDLFNKKGGEKIDKL